MISAVQINNLQGRIVAIFVAFSLVVAIFWLSGVATFANSYIRRAAIPYWVIFTSIAVPAFVGMYWWFCKKPKRLLYATALNVLAGYLVSVAASLICSLLYYENTFTGGISQVLFSTLVGPLMLMGWLVGFLIAILLYIPVWKPMYI